MSRRFGGWILVAALVTSAPSPARGQAAIDTTPVQMSFGVKIPLRDGVSLNATLYRPKPQEGPLPVVFWMTPYIADMAHDRAMYFARNGYVFAVVDTRGRGNSDGAFEPFANERDDGPQVVEWLARQPYSNGKTSGWGGSYGGFWQWATVKSRPPAFVSMAPVASAHPGVDFPQLRNIFRSYAIQWLTFTSGVTPQTSLFSDPSFWLGKYGERYREHRAFASLDTIAGNLTTVYQTWMDHPTPDAYWDRMTPTAEEYAAIDLPILTITGYFDGDQLGALEYYRRHMRHGTASARARHFLILGPWDHPGTRTPVKSIGGLDFGDASILDMNALHKEWYDWTLKSGPRPSFLKKRVAYWVMGAEEWKYADDVESIADSTLRLHLDSDGGRAGDVLHSGWLRAAPPAGRTPDAFTYDPLDTSPLALEMRPPRRDYYRDQTAAHNLNGNGLIYHTEPFAEATEISGTPRLTAWMSMDVPDTDFEVSLYEVRPDGSVIYLADDALRARYRESMREGKPVPVGEVTKFVFDQFTFFSRRIDKGSRLRLVLRAQNSLAWEKNYNSGGVVARETAASARVARIQLHHDRDRPTTLELPVVRPESHRLVP